MSSRQALDAKASSMMLILCVFWGLQQVVLKVAAADISPLMQLALRSGLVCCDGVAFVIACKKYTMGFD